MRHALAAQPGRQLHPVGAGSSSAAYIFSLDMVSRCYHFFLAQPVVAGLFFFIWDMFLPFSYVLLHVQVVGTEPP
ncbi:hypothetical protein CDD83_126 [Cordyceps sp. RAO-2017]|nr:hypothetical protein CDD83_126 [Cordyceps sp. RAO-2017]